MKKSKIILIISFVIVGVALINAGISQIDAQISREDFTKSDKNIKYQRIQFELYVLVKDVGDGNQFINDIEAEKIRYVLKGKQFKTQINEWCDDSRFGKIYQISGYHVFKRNIDASLVKEWFKTNIPTDKIQFAEFYLLENNHHWDRPTPDEVIEYRTYGNEKLFREIADSCGS